MSDKMIPENKIRCKLCDDTIVSTIPWQKVYCSCGACAVDGGDRFRSRIGRAQDFEELTSRPGNAVRGQDATPPPQRKRAARVPSVDQTDQMAALKAELKAAQAQIEALGQGAVRQAQALEEAKDNTAKAMQAGTDNDLAAEEARETPEKEASPAKASAASKRKKPAPKKAGGAANVSRLGG